jgi:hypothetical protein
MAHWNERIDPVEDEDFPRIRAYDPETDDPVWPETWSQAPTERDQAAIDSGAAEKAYRMAVEELEQTPAEDS